jgi:hypothetical protein
VDLLSYFDLLDSYYFTYGQTIKNEPVKFEICDKADQFILSDFLGKNFTLPEGINLCPRISFHLPVTSFETFGLFFSLRECVDEKLGCKQDNEFYDQLRNQTYLLQSMFYFIKSEENMLNDIMPYSFSFFDKGYIGVNTSLTVNLEGSEIYTQSLFGFFGHDSHSQLKVLNFEDSEPFPNELVGYRILFNSKEYTFHNRTYKTINIAFSNAFSLFKLYSWVFSVILNSYYSYNINTIIINTNFDFENSTKDNNNENNENSLIKNQNNLESPSETVLKQSPLITYKRNTEGKKKLTMPLVVKRITWLRCCFCMGNRNKVRKFYKISTNIINKNLSIENLLTQIFEYSQFKHSVIEKIGLREFDTCDYKHIVDCDKDFNVQGEGLEVLNDTETKKDLENSHSVDRNNNT